MLGDDSFSLEDLALVINQDPGLSARILGLANSAYFAQQNPVLTVEDAIIRVLGLNMVKSLAFSIAVTGTFESSACRSFDLQEYWSHSLSIATLAKQISLAVGHEKKLDAEAAYLAGLLYDIGVLVLVYEFPEEYARVLLMSKQQPDRDLLELETEVIGIDHRQAGIWLGHRWHLPEIVVKVMAHTAGEQADQAGYCESILVSDVAEWVKTPLPTEAKLAQALPGLEAGCGLSQERLETIKTGFLHKEEGIHLIARLLAK
jgi:HD-like signal output (HDOD) protein